MYSKGCLSEPSDSYTGLRVPPSYYLISGFFTYFKGYSRVSVVYLCPDCKSSNTIHCIK